MTIPGRAGIVTFRSDGLDLTPAECCAIAAQYVARQDGDEDNYSLGGLVAKLEVECARMLGKEAAVFMPTGTLANHIALRRLARDRNRVIVPEQSHIYNDSGDCLQTLSGLNALPLGAGKAGFTLAEVEAAAEQTRDGRVENRIGAILIETPVRRRYGETFDLEEMRRIGHFARAQGIGLHLDGARLFIASAYSGIPVREYADLFDTVYVSLYKYFNTPSGAILAGPRLLLEGAYHERRMFGGGLHQAWFFAAVALAFLPGFEARFQEAVDRSRPLFDRLSVTPGIRIETIPQGSNVLRAVLDPAIDPSRLRSSLAASGVRLPAPETSFHGFYLRVNESLASIDVDELASRFENALREAHSP
jgi:threonine aldolase